MPTRALLLALPLLLGTVAGLEARPHRPAQIPNGTCGTCHVNPSGGGARNAFGLEVQAGFLTSNNASGDVIWGFDLASLDADGDGASNGQELGDPDGFWQPGDANPNVAATNPGDASSYPEPTQDFGGWTIYAPLDHVDVGEREIGIGSARLVVEGQVFDEDGNVITVNDLPVEAPVWVNAQPSIDPALFYAREIRLTKDFDLPDGGHRFYVQVRGVDNGDVIVGDFLRRVTSDADLRNAENGAALTLADFQPGDFVEYVVTITEFGDWVTALARNPVHDRGPPGFVTDQFLQHVDDEDVVFLDGPVFTMSGDVTATDESGNAVAPASIAAHTPIILHFDPNDADLVTLIEAVPEGVFPQDPGDLLQRMDSVDNDKLLTREPFGRALIREAAITFGDGSQATADDLVPGPVRVSILHPRADHPPTGDIIDSIVIDPPGFAGGDGPPTPTQTFGEWFGVARLDVIDEVEGIGFAGLRVVPEGDIIGPDGNAMSVNDLQEHDFLVVEGEVTKARDVMFARTIHVNPPDHIDAISVYTGVVRVVDNGDIVVGDWVRWLHPEAQFSNGSGQTLALSDFLPGDLVEFTIAQTDVGDLVSALVREPVLDEPLVPEPWDFFTRLGFVDDVGLLWTFGPDFDVSDADVFNAAGGAIALADLMPLDRVAIAVIPDPDPATGNRVATRIDVLGPDTPFPDGAELWSVDGVDGSTMRVYDPWPKRLARDATITFGDGSAATRNDLVDVFVKMVVEPQPLGEAFLGDVVAAVTIDPPEPEQERPVPTETFGEWVGLARLDVIDGDQGVGFAGLRVVPEGDIFGPDGNAIGVNDLQADQFFVARGEVTSARDVMFAREIHVEPQAFLDGEGTYSGVVRRIDNGEIVAGDFVRWLHPEAAYRDGGGASLALGDFQPGDLVEYTIAHTDAGDFVSLLVRNPPVDEPPATWDFFTGLAFVDDAGLITTIGPDFLIADAAAFDAGGGAIDAAQIPAGAEIAVTTGADPVDGRFPATRIDVLGPDSTFPDGAEFWLFDGVEADVMRTLDPFQKWLARDAELSFGDGSAANRSDLQSVFVKLVVQPQPAAEPFLGDVVIAVVIDPQEAPGPGGGGDRPPEPTEFFGEWPGLARLDLIDVEKGQAGFGGLRLIPEGPIVAPDGSTVAVADLRVGDHLTVTGPVTRDRTTIYGRHIRLDATGVHLGPADYPGVVRFVDGDQVQLGDWARWTLLDGAYTDGATGQALTLADFQPGDLVEYTIAHTNEGDFVSALVRNPQIEGPLEPEPYTRDDDLAFVDDLGLAWVWGPEFLVDGVPFEDSQGNAVDPAQIEPLTLIAVLPAGDPTPDAWPAQRVEVLSETQPFPTDPNALLHVFEAVEGGVLRTLQPFATRVARDVEVRRGDGSAASVDDLAGGGPVRMLIDPAPPWEFDIHDVIVGIVIDPPPPEAERPPEPTEFFGEWAGLARLDVIDGERGQVGFGGLRVIPEGEIIGPDGSPVPVSDLRRGDHLTVSGPVTRDRRTIYGRRIRLDAGDVRLGPADYPGIVRFVQDGQVQLGDWLRWTLLDGQYTDGPTGQPLTLTDLQPGDLVEYTIAQTNEGDFVSALVRNPALEEPVEPETYTRDDHLAFIDDLGLAWVRGPEFLIDGGEFVDELGNGVDPTQIAPQTPIAVFAEGEPTTAGWPAQRVEVLSPDDTIPAEPAALLYVLEAVEGGVLRTLQPFATRVAQDVDVFFADGAVATEQDLADGGPVRMVIAPAPPWEIDVHDLIIGILIDPPDFGGGGEPPVPTEIFDVWTGLGRLSVVEARGVGFSAFRLVPEGRFIGPEGEQLTAADVRRGDYLVVLGEIGRDRTVFGRSMFVNPVDFIDGPALFQGEAQAVTATGIAVGSPLRPLLPEAELLDAEGQLLELDGFQPGDVVEYEISITDVGDYVSRLVRNPALEEPLEQPPFDVDDVLAFVGDFGDMWFEGPVVDIAAAEFVDADGAAVDPTTIEALTRLAVFAAAGAEPAQELVAQRILVLGPDAPFPDDPEAQLQRFAAVDETRLRTLQPFPTLLARDAPLFFGDGAEAARSDLTGGPVRLRIQPASALAPEIGEIAVGVVIDPPGFGGEPPEPTQVLGEFEGLAVVDLVDLDRGLVGFGGARLIVEGDVVDDAGEPVALDQIEPGDPVLATVEASTDPTLLYARHIVVRPDRPESGGNVIDTEVRDVDVDEGVIFVGEFARPLMPNARLFDAAAGELTLADFAPGDLVGYVVAITDVGDFLQELVRNPDVELPDVDAVWDLELISVEADGLVWFAGPRLQLAPEAPIVDLEDNPVDPATIAFNAPIAVRVDPEAPDVALGVRVLGDGEVPNRGGVELWRFRGLDADGLLTIDFFERWLARDAQLSFGDGEPATRQDLVPGPVRVFLRHPGLTLPSIGDVIDAVVIDPPDFDGGDGEPLSFDDWLPGEDLDEDGEIDRTDYRAYVWLRNGRDLNGDGSVDFGDFEEHLLGSGTDIGGDPQLEVGPISLDFDPADGDQQRTRAGRAVPGREYTLQFNVAGAVDIQGWSATLTFDPEHLAYVGDSFEPSDFIAGGLALERSAAGEIGVGLTLLNSDAVSSGDGSLGTVRLRVLEGFSGSTEVEMVRSGLSFRDGDPQFVSVSFVVTITDQAVGTPPVGDFDGDGIVDFPDFFEFARVFWTENDEFDLNGDGFIDFADFFIFADHFGEEAALFKLLALAQQHLGLPAEASVGPNYPNPFNSTTTIPIALPRAAEVKLTIYDVVGQQVRTLVAGRLPAGPHVVEWDGRNDAGRAVAGGVYLYRLRLAAADGYDGFSQVRKLTLLE